MLTTAAAIAAADISFLIVASLAFRNIPAVAGGMAVPGAIVQSPRARRQEASSHGGHARRQNGARLSRLERHDLLALRTETLDAEFDHVAGFHQMRCATSKTMVLVEPFWRFRLLVHIA